MSIHVPCTQCSIRYSSVNWYVKRPLHHTDKWIDGEIHTQYEVWCMICYGREIVPDLYIEFLDKLH